MKQWAASYSANGDAMGRPSCPSSFLGDAGANFFCTGYDVLEILPHPRLRFTPNTAPFGRHKESLQTGCGG